MATPPEEMGPVWVVTDVRDTTRVTPAGRFEEGREIFFRLADIGEFSVFVPAQAFSPEVVRGMIEAEARRILEVRGMTG